MNHFLLTLPTLVSAGYYDKYSGLGGSSGATSADDGTSPYSSYSTIDKYGNYSTKPFLPPAAVYMSMDAGTGKTSPSGKATVNIISNIDQNELLYYLIGVDTTTHSSTSITPSSSDWTDRNGGKYTKADGSDRRIPSDRNFTTTLCPTDSGSLSAGQGVLAEKFWADDPWPKCAELWNNRNRAECFDYVDFNADTMHIYNTCETESDCTDYDNAVHIRVHGPGKFRGAKRCDCFPSPSGLTVTKTESTDTEDGAEKRGTVHTIADSTNRQSADPTCGDYCECEVYGGVRASFVPDPLSLELDETCTEVAVVPVYYLDGAEVPFYSLMTPVWCPLTHGLGGNTTNGISDTNTDGDASATCSTNRIECRIPTPWRGVESAGTIVSSTNSAGWTVTGKTTITYLCGSETIDSADGWEKADTKANLAADSDGCYSRDFNGTQEGGGVSAETDAGDGANLGKRRYVRGGNTMNRHRLEWLREWVELTVDSTNRQDPRSSSDVLPRDVFCYCKTPLYADVTTSGVQSWYVTLNPYGGSLASEAETAMSVTLKTFSEGTYTEQFTLAADKQNTLPKTTTEFYLQAVTTTAGIRIQISDVTAARTAADAITPGPNRLVLAGRFCAHPQFGNPATGTKGSIEDEDSGGSDQDGETTHSISFNKFRFLGQPEVYFAARIRACEDTDTGTLNCREQYDVPACDSTNYPTTDLGARSSGTALNDASDTNFNYRQRQLQGRSDTESQEFIALVDSRVGDDAPTVQSMLNPPTQAAAGAAKVEMTQKSSNSQARASANKAQAANGEEDSGMNFGMMGLIAGVVLVAIFVAAYAFMSQKPRRATEEAASTETGREMISPRKDPKTEKYAVKVGSEAHDVL